MKYLVADAGFKHGKDRNLLFATNDKQEAIKVAKDSGSGVVVIKQNEKDKRLMQALDVISSKFGRDTIRFGVQRNKECWQMKAEMKSHKYTTCLKEVLQIS